MILECRNDKSHQIPLGLEAGWNHFLLFGNAVKTRKGMKGNHLIWLTTTWYIWKLRNNILFRGMVSDSSALVDDIKACLGCGLEVE
jgi:hypothetical protein